MADALCGPSNALQNIHKHASVDRTLQQDRLATRHLPSQDFRSSSGLNNGVLDAEFEAFQAGLPLGSGLREQELFQPNSIAKPVPFFSPQQQFPGWASDFQRLGLDEARSSSIPTSQFRYEAPIHRSTAGGWHQEFLQNQNLGATQGFSRPQGYGNMHWNYQQQQLQGVNATFGSKPFQIGDTSISQQNQPQSVIDSEFDEAAFERAFETARLEMVESEIVRLHESPTATDEVLSDHDAAKLSTDRVEQHANRRTRMEPEEISRHNLLRAMMMKERLEGSLEWEPGPVGPVGPDKVEPHLYENITEDPFTEEKADLQSNVEADELARTAGQLLDKLKHEQSEKFQQSNFLSLMRQLRDKEVRVEGEKIVDTAQTPHPGGQNYPNDGPVMSGAVNTTTAVNSEHASAIS